MNRYDEQSFMRGFYAEAEESLDPVIYAAFKVREDNGWHDWGTPWNWLNTRHEIADGYEPEEGESMADAGRRWFVENYLKIEKVAIKDLLDYADDFR